MPISFLSSRKKLTQLQHAYTCLFRDYDSKLKNEVKQTILLHLCHSSNTFPGLIGLLVCMLSSVHSQFTQTWHVHTYCCRYTCIADAQYWVLSTVIEVMSKTTIKLAAYPIWCNDCFKYFYWPPQLVHVLLGRQPDCCIN